MKKCCAGCRAYAGNECSFGYKTEFYEKEFCGERLKRPKEICEKPLTEEAFSQLAHIKELAVRKENQ